MALSHRDRFKLKSNVTDSLMSDQWSYQKADLLFSEFGLGHIDASDYSDSIVGALSFANDSVLVEMYGVVMGVDIEEVIDVVEASDGTGMWRSGMVRLFLSHSAIQKSFIADVANELAVVGIHGFVAHDAMEYSKPWQEQIEKALRSMEVFVAIVHPEFVDSAWCHEEVGWALGRRVPLYVVRMGNDPNGFTGRDQWPSGFGKSAKEIAALIHSWVATVPELGASIIDSLFKELAAAGDYWSAGAAAARVAALGSLSDEDFSRLNEIWWSNNQLYGGVLPSREMQPFYERNGRTWPPYQRPQATQPEEWTGESPF